MAATKRKTTLSGRGIKPSYKSIKNKYLKPKRESRGEQGRGVQPLKKTKLCNENIIHKLLLSLKNAPLAAAGQRGREQRVP
jgi:hypothetical protein